MVTRFVKWAGIITAAIYFYFSLTGIQPMRIQRGIILASFLLLAPLKGIGKQKSRFQYYFSLLISLIGFLIMIYFIRNLETIQLKMMGPSGFELVIGAGLILLVLEGTRRTMGYGMVSICIVAIVYALFGQHLPGILHHAPISLDQLIYYLGMTSEGIWGTALTAAAGIIIIFIMFGCFMDTYGAGKFFEDLGMKLFGKVRGGPAKLSVFTSALFGSISGSPVANVMVTGSFTIPLMKKYGYDSDFAGGVEAAASTGGQIMPPIMGAAAFVMAEVLGISYWAIVKAAIIPAILYFAAIFFMVDFEAGKKGLIINYDLQTASAKQLVAEGWHVVTGMVFLVYVMGVMGMSPTRAATYAIILLTVLTIFQRRGRIKLAEIIKSFEDTANGVIAVVGACAAAGIIIGVVNITGLGVRFSDILVTLAGGNIWILLILTMFASIVLGMGVPTVAAYIILAVLVAPSIYSLGIPLLAAHMFVFYFGVLAPVTPPVAMGAYAAAGISGGDPMKTGFRGLQLALAAFIVPFMFVRSPALMLNGEATMIIMVTVTSMLGIYALAGALVGYLNKNRINSVQRVFLLIAAFMLMDPELTTDIIGITSFALAVILGRFFQKKRIRKLFK